mmetsp:Transcript_67933/g.191492  ORF Transcript_67933/g.191492 Transcript_67933/m.191492 type:complete len:202 (-) Transcript_67933:837-1442(-)
MPQQLGILARRCSLEVSSRGRLGLERSQRVPSLLDLPVAHGGRTRIRERRPQPVHVRRLGGVPQLLRRPPAGTEEAQALACRGDLRAAEPRRCRGAERRREAVRVLARECQLQPLRGLVPRDGTVLASMEEAKRVPGGLQVRVAEARGLRGVHRCQQTLLLAGLHRLLQLLAVQRVRLQPGQLLAEVGHGAVVDAEAAGFL